MKQDFSMKTAKSFSIAYYLEGLELEGLEGLKPFMYTFHKFLAINSAELSNCKYIFITHMNVYNTKMSFFYLRQICMRRKKDWG